MKTIHRLLARLTLFLALFALPAAHAAPGDVDTLDANMVGTHVLATAVQPDGKTILGGPFTSVLGVVRNSLARLNADGTLDAGFNPNTNGTVYCMAVQADGKILLGGSFSTVGGTARSYIARLNADGTLDADFNPNANGLVYCMAVQADGKVLLSGGFTTVSGIARSRIARLNADGTLDASFNPNASGVVSSVALQLDGKILLGGTFATVGGTARNRIARVNGDGTLDASFNPNANSYVNSLAVQADGKILLSGGFTTVGGTARNRIARLNADGTLDAVFNPNASSDVVSVAVQGDGKILLGGDFTIVGATARNRIARVNADGTLDAGFNPNANNTVHGVAVQGDGKILLGGSFTTVGGTARNHFARLLNNPATQTLTVPDSTQALWSRTGAGPELTRVTFELSADGGTTYTALAAGTRVGTSANWQLTSLALSGNGLLRARGWIAGGSANGSTGLIEQVTAFSFTAPEIDVQQPALTSIASGGSKDFGNVNVNTTSDLTFTIANTGTAALNLTGTPKVAVSGSVDFSVTAQPTSAVAASGTTIFTVRFAPTSTGTKTATLTIANDDTNEGTYTVTVTGKAPSPGDVDSLNANVVGGYVFATAVQSDGKMILAGTFIQLLGVPRNNIARLNADGTLDTGFDPKPNGDVYSMAVQADGKVLLGGNFTNFQPNGAVTATTRKYVARVNADGTLDSGFDPQANSTVSSVALQADGKVLLVGYFFALQPNGAASETTRKYVARLNADGTLDAGFDPKASDPVVTVAVQADGKVLLGGAFITLQPNGGALVPRQRVARVNADGTLDTGFNPMANGVVYSVVEQADGKVLLGGQFTTLQPNGAASATLRQRVARLNADGTLDAGFDPQANSVVYSLAVQADGKVLLGGLFTALQPNGASPTVRRGVARVNADGTLDAGFDPKANNGVYSVAIQADGKVLLGGDFTTLQPNGAAFHTTRTLFARLNNDPASQTLSAPSSTQVLWTRAGAGPELTRVTFEQSTDGGTTYTALAAGTRVGTSANWQLTGLALSGNGLLRARGWPMNGYSYGGTGLIEQVTAFSFSDTTAPETTITSNTPAVTSTTATITFTGTDNVAVTSFEGNLDGASYATVTSPTSLNGLAQGAHTFSVRAKDAPGNVDATPATVSWTVDTVAPTFTLPGNLTREATSAAGAVVTYSASSSDLFGSGVATSSFTPTSGSTFPIGTTTVNASATDNAGNTATGTFTVTVSDTTAPVVAAHGDVTAEATSAAGAVVNFAAGSATDAVTASPTITYSQASGTSFPVGVTTVTISAEDAAHNVGTGTFTVTVGDMTGPVITLNGDTALYAALNSTFTDPGATALDAVDGSVTVNVAGSVNTSVAGDYTLTYTAEDATHHAATPVVRTVTVYLAAVAVNDLVTATAGETRCYPLANDYDPLGTELSLVSTDGPGVVIEDRALVIPAGYVGTFTYVATNGRGPSSASVTVLAGTPVTARSQWAGLLYDSTGAIAGRMQTLRNSAGRFTYAVRVGANQIGGIFALDAMHTATIGGLTVTEDADHRLAITYASGGTLTGNLRQSAASVTPRQLNVALAGADRTALPGGGYLRAYVRTASKVNILGVLPDGRSFVTVSPLADNGSISFYITATRTPGAFIGGELTLGDLPATDCTGEVEWTHNGALTTLTANGSLYSASAALPSGACTLTLAGGNLASTTTSATNAVSGKPALSTAIPAWLAKPATGIFVARVKTPGSFRAVKGSGIYLQKSHSAWGYFPGTPLGGSISLTQP